MNQAPENWVLVYKSTSEYRVDIVHALMDENKIESQIINTHDHTFDTLNVTKEVGLYVHKNDVEKASSLIKQSESE
ncbi:DUF2007 domain-containing protein [Salibacteraceae bacterium]|nr:DUF2007 domain-containing protein [Flavobacteriales bacterium]MDB9701528.1 DUF2007 domain-containing protein [Salibacteraceae bacterium]